MSDTKDIKKSFLAMWKQYASAGTEYAQKLLMNQASICLWEDFYTQYDPKMYDREYNILSNSYYPYQHTTMGTKILFEGGIVVSSSNMFGYKSKGWRRKNHELITNSEIVDWVWLQGLHGNTQTLPTPSDTLTNFINSNKFWNEIDRYASSKIK